MCGAKIVKYDWLQDIKQEEDISIISILKMSLCNRLRNTFAPGRCTLSRSSDAASMDTWRGLYVSLVFAGTMRSYHKKVRSSDAAGHLTLWHRPTLPVPLQPSTDSLENARRVKKKKKC